MSGERFFRAAWGAVWVRGGHRGLLPFLVDTADAGFDGVEIPVPVLEAVHRLPYGRTLRGALLDRRLQLGAGILTRASGVDAHLRLFRRQVNLAVDFGAVRGIAIVGEDTFTRAEAVRFYAEAHAHAVDRGLEVAFETHRGTPLFHPNRAMAILSDLPDLPLCADYSHWAVSTGSLLEDFGDVLERCAPNVVHVQTRVGHPDGPQVFDPRAPEAAEALEAHLRWWAGILAADPLPSSTGRIITPEFGPAPYAPVPVGRVRRVDDVPAINLWMAERMLELVESA